VPERDEQETKRLAVANKRVRYQVPGIEKIPVRRVVAFRGASGRVLSMDVFSPCQSGPSPVVVIPMAYPDPAGRLRGFGPVVSWAQLLAASGMAAVVYGAERPTEDVHAALNHVRSEADALGVDASRIRLFATSGNVTVGLATLMRDRQLRCAAFLYGYTMDLDGSTTVADSAAQFGFENACAGRSIDDLPFDVPILFVRAGQDQFPGLNAALDAVVRQALDRNAEIWLINHATASHGFDLDDASDVSGGVVQQALAFLRLHLRV